MQFLVYLISGLWETNSCFQQCSREGHELNPRTNLKRWSVDVKITTQTTTGQQRSVQRILKPDSIVFSQFPWLSFSPATLRAILHPFLISLTGLLGNVVFYGYSHNPSLCKMQSNDWEWLWLNASVLHLAQIDQGMNYAFRTQSRKQGQRQSRIFTGVLDSVELLQVSFKSKSFCVVFTGQASLQVAWSQSFGSSHSWLNSMEHMEVDICVVMYRVCVCVLL